MLNDNGGWCWFQDQRAIFTTDGRLLVSSVAVSPGTGSGTRSGSVEITNRELATGRTWIDTLYRGVTSDDHNAAAMVQLPTGRVEALFTDHSFRPYIHPTHVERGDLGWTRDTLIYRPEADVIDLSTGLDRKSGVTYSNPIYLADENLGRGRLYDFFRSHGERPHVTWSDDGGKTWARGGELLNRFRAYTRYIGDGHRRVWFITTDGHPSIFNGTSLYAGYIQGGRVHRSDGTDIGSITASLDPARLTVVARGVPGSTASQVDYWGADIELEPVTGHPVITFSDRHPGDSPVAGRTYTHDYFTGRWTGSGWNVSRLSAGGSELYAGPLNSQPDYTGLSAVDPADPNHVFISTDVDPVTNRPLISSADHRAHWEISEGRSRDNGRTWTWSAVTQNSTVDNLRPIVPKPVRGNQAVLWLRGTYPDFLRYDLDVVGLIQPAAGRPSVDPPGRPHIVGYHVTYQVVAAGDLDRNGRSDLVFSGTSGVENSEVLSLPGGWHRSVFRVPAAGDGTQTLVGDFDGNGAADTFSYTPGAAIDVIRLHNAAGQYDTVKTRVNGTAYRPIVGDFDGDHRDDIFWYAPGAASDSMWMAIGGGAFRSRPIVVNGQYRAVAGDLNGDGRDDIVWYAPGKAHDSVWIATGGGAFRTQSLQVSGQYQPMTGDFDRNGRDDIFWYGPGAGADHVWLSRRAGGFKLLDTAVRGTYQPAAGDFDGDGYADIAWYDPLHGGVRYWYGSGLFPDGH